MTHTEKIEWMKDYCFRNKFILELEGECGFGRECVGITSGESYPDYYIYDEDYNQIDNNGYVWTPVDAYHKHTCVAVLGRGEEAESQLYEWLKWFEDNGFIHEEGVKPINELRKMNEIEVLMGRHKYNRLVKKS